MTPALKTIIYPVADLAASKATYAALLGAEPLVDETYYVQFNLANQEVGLDPNGKNKGMTGPVAFWHVDDIYGAIKQLIDSGATQQEAVTDFGNRLVVTLKDPDGNPIGLIQNT